MSTLESCGNNKGEPSVQGKPKIGISVKIQMQINHDMFKLLQLITSTFSEIKSVQKTVTTLQLKFKEDNKSSYLKDKLSADIMKNIDAIYAKSDEIATNQTSEFFKFISSQEYYSRLHKEKELPVFWEKVHGICKNMVMISSLGDTLSSFDELASDFVGNAGGSITKENFNQKSMEKIKNDPVLRGKLFATIAKKENLKGILGSLNPLLASTMGGTAEMKNLFANMSSQQNNTNTDDDKNTKTDELNLRPCVSEFATGDDMKQQTIKSSKLSSTKKSETLSKPIIDMEGMDKVMKLLDDIPLEDNDIEELSNGLQDMANNTEATPAAMETISMILNSNNNGNGANIDMGKIMTEFLPVMTGTGPMADLLKSSGLNNNGMLDIASAVIGSSNNTSDST